MLEEQDEDNLRDNDSQLEMLRILTQDLVTPNHGRSETVRAEKGSAAIDGHTFNRGEEENAGLTPSELLTEALRDTGHLSSLPWQAIGKFDLTFTNPQFPNHAEAHRSKKAYGYKKSRESLQAIVARYIRFCADRNHGQTAIEITEKELGQVFTSDALRYLEERHFDATDVVSWAWVVTAHRSEDAAKRLNVLADGTSDPLHHKRNKAPIFLLLFLLRRPNVDASALRLCIAHAWNMLRNVHIKSSSETVRDPRVDPTTLRFMRWAVTPKRTNSGNHSPIEQRTLAILIIRLMRHARNVWPEALPYIAKMLATAHADLIHGAKLSIQKHARLTFLYNRMLRLIALPPAQHPMLSVEVRQRAQLELLRRMSETQPPLAVTREGYRAVIALQISNRKTAQEREWAILKGLSWPPWKDAKSGLDEDKDVDLGISRAKRAIQRAAEAGYASDTWEQAASILAGWDTDNSPTIQTRTVYNPQFISKPSTSSAITQRDGPVTPASRDESTVVWAARIQATRTVDEAWACFLNYDQGRSVWSAQVCYHMFVKLVLARQSKILRAHTAEDSTPLPGDALEISQSSENPRERPYLKVPPPDEHRFIDMAIKHHVDFRGAFLAFMISHAETKGVGIQYIRISSLPQSLKDVLLERKPMNTARFTSHLYPVLAAVVRLFQNFTGDVWQKSKARIHEKGVKPGDSVSEGPRIPLVFARRLLFEHGYPYKPAWYSLLSAMVKADSAVIASSELIPIRDRVAHAMAAWDAITHVLLRMESLDISLDFAGFNMVTVGFEKSAIAAQQILDRPLPEQISSNDSSLHLAQRRRARAKRILATGVNYLKRLFVRLTSTPMAVSDNGYGQLTTDGKIMDSGDRESDSARISAVHNSGEPPTPAMPTQLQTEGELHGDQDELNMRPDEFMGRMLQVPSPAHLHAFMRVLGITRDHQGIIDLLKWMSFFEPEISAAASELRNGDRLMRRTLVCARVMLEEWWEKPVDPAWRTSGQDYHLDEDDTVSGGAAIHEEPVLRPDQEDEQNLDEAESDEERIQDAFDGQFLQQAKEIVEAVTAWDGWPSDRECETYTSHKRSRLQ